MFDYEPYDLEQDWEMPYRQCVDAGLFVIPLHKIIRTVSGPVCGCGDPECKAVGKHPVSSGWQNVTFVWDDEQLAAMRDQGQLESYGVNLAGRQLVVDIDQRNGGVESFQRLCADIGIDLMAAAGFVVLTGSGGGSRHLYFTKPDGVSLMQGLKQYPGIDFKSTGFVVGFGSEHASGMRYERDKGFPDDICLPPDALVDLLRFKGSYTGNHGGALRDVTAEELVRIVGFVRNNDVSYDDWLSVGMALHDTTSGSDAGFDLWLDWSSTSAKHDPQFMSAKWHSFGKSRDRRYTLGTLIHLAREGGYVESVEFECLDVFEVPAAAVEIDALRPPGFVGDLVDWINDQCLYPRETLAVAAALSAVSNIAGMRLEDELDGMSMNLFAFCVAGSSTGKESVLSAYNRILAEAKMSAAIYGTFKSEQEIYRNLLRHQGAFYTVDEMGQQLKKITGGKSDYLTAIVGTLMSAYSKHNGCLYITGDLKEEIREKLLAEIAKIERLMDQKGETPELRARSAAAMRQLSTISEGIKNPYLSILGFTAPVAFDELFTFEQATNGFLSRALIFREQETNPRWKEGFKARPMPDSIKHALWNLRSPGAFSYDNDARVEWNDEKDSITTTASAKAALDAAKEKFWQMAERHKDSSGLEAIPRRGYEMVAKLSLILAAHTRVRTDEHVLWATEVVSKDISGKLLLARGNSAEGDGDRMAAKIVSYLSKDTAVTLGVLRNRIRGFSEASLKALVEAGVVVEKDTGKTRAGKPVLEYLLSGKAGV